MDYLLRVDHNAIRANQALIILLLLAGFVFNFPWLVGLTALVMLAGSLTGRPGFWFFYSGILVPIGWLKPDLVPDNPEPHRFAQAFGGMVLVGSGLLFLTGSGTAAWGLSWVVILLASLNLFGGFCAGCFVYYWLSRAGVPGFSKNPPGSTYPGMRPKAR